MGFELTCRCLLRLSRWAELIVSWRERSILCVWSGGGTQNQKTTTWVRIPIETVSDRVRVSICADLSYLSGLHVPPQWGAADAEIKVPSGENTELKRCPFKAWSRSVYSHTCYAYCRDFFLAYFYPTGSFACIFPNLSRFLLCWL